MTPTAAIEDAKKLVPIEKFKEFDRSLQVRGGIDHAKVLEYRQIIRETGQMGGVVVYRDGETCYLADGFHRLEAYEAEAISKIQTIFREGTRSDALTYALRENGHHGSQMTNAQKRHAAEMAVMDPQLGEKSDKDLAFVVGCSPSLIAECRRGETPASKKQKKERKQRESQTASGNRESESPAPRSATVRQRKPEDNRPTKKMVLKQIESYVNDGVVDEQDVLALFDSKEAEYRWVPKTGGRTTLKVVGKSGREQICVPVIVKEVLVDEICLKYEDGRVEVAE